MSVPTAGFILVERSKEQVGLKGIQRSKQVGQEGKSNIFQKKSNICWINFFKNVTSYATFICTTFHSQALQMQEQFYSTLYLQV